MPTPKKTEKECCCEKCSDSEMMSGGINYTCENPYCSCHPTPPDTTEWEKELGKLDDAVEFEWGIDSPEYKTFERLLSLLSSQREALREKVEKMKRTTKWEKNICKHCGDYGLEIGAHQCDSYNQALSDVLQALKDGE